MKEKRRWVRFSLRGLLIAMALISAVLGWRIKALRDVDRAIARLSEGGFGVWIDASASPGKGRMVDGVKYARQNYWRRFFRGEEQRGYTLLQKTATKVNADNLCELVPLMQKFHRIDCIDLHGAAVDDETLIALAPLSQLRSLWLYSTTRVSPAGIAQLRESLPQCHVHLTGAQPG